MYMDNYQVFKLSNYSHIAKDITHGFKVLCAPKKLMIVYLCLMS